MPVQPSRAAVEQVTEEIGRLRSVPADARAYVVASQDAEKRFGLSPTTLQELMTVGLPYRQKSDGLCFDEADLAYLATKLGTARAHLTMFSLLVQSLNGIVGHGSAEAVVRYVPLLAEGTKRLPGKVFLPDVGRREVELVHNQVAAEVLLTLTAHHPPSPPELVKALDGMQHLNLYALQDPLSDDVAFSRRTGLCNCYTAAYLTTECCRSANFEARIAEGLLVFPPWSQMHYWCEVQVGDDWLSLDPLIVLALRRFGGLDAEAWPLHRSIVGLLARYPENALPIITTTAAVPVEARYMTSVRAFGAAAAPPRTYER
jgi:Transglutaminase-like superfamily